VVSHPLHVVNQSLIIAILRKIIRMMINIIVSKWSERNKIHSIDTASPESILILASPESILILMSDWLSGILINIDYIIFLS
tara:strand:- start:221109 stop:221354 length:246 start_codon:yes stop_codon:yes gene_type:complete